ncbi:hypothetical protein ACFLRH_03050 [Actinomycetota bacterium]
MILGLLQPTSGSVSVLGAPPSRESRRRVGYVPQNLGLYRDLTTAENLEFRAAAFGGLPADRPFTNNGLIGALPLGLQRRPPLWQLPSMIRPSWCSTNRPPASLLSHDPSCGTSFWSVPRREQPSSFLRTTWMRLSRPTGSSSCRGAGWPAPGRWQTSSVTCTRSR